MIDGKTIENTEKEAIRLQLLASMLAVTNSEGSNRLNRVLPKFWRSFLKKTKVMQ